jgi:hypothetical protein
MLKWTRWAIWEKGEMGLLVERIYWIKKVSDRGRKESLLNGKCIDDWSGV